MNILTRLWRKYLINENGQGLTEYGLVIVLVAIALVIAVTAFGNELYGYYQNIVASF